MDTRQSSLDDVNAFRKDSMWSNGDFMEGKLESSKVVDFTSKQKKRQYSVLYRLRYLFKSIYVKKLCTGRGNMSES